MAEVPPRTGRRPLGEGAAESAPTAPHATPAAPPAGEGRRPRTGPARFWARWPARAALGAALVASTLSHCAVVPFGIPSSFDVNDVDGEAEIPIDMFESQEPPPEPEPPPPPPPPEPTAAATGVDDKSAPKPPHPEAGAPRDAGADVATPTDAALDGPAADASSVAPPPARPEAGASPLADAGARTDAGAAPDAEPPASPAIAGGPRDPVGVVGEAGDIQVDKVLVLVVINAEVIRKNPAAVDLGALLHGMPQWADFMKGTDIDPVRDVDWVMISGPSVVDTSRDVVLVHMGVSDAKVAKAMDIVAGNYAQGGGFDAGVPSVRAVRAFADRAERVVLLPRPHVIAVVPSSAATRIARKLARASVPAHVIKGDAAYVRFVDPHRAMPQLPASITELRTRIVLRDDDGADVFIDGDTHGEGEARDAAAAIGALIRQRNDMFTAMATGNLLGGVETTSEGPTVKLHVVASRQQIATILGLVAAFTGTPLPRPAASH